MKDLKTLKQETRKIYNSIVSVYCPILEETIYFTSEGYYHMIFESNRKPRNINEQWLKLKSFPYVRRVVERCKKVSEVRKVNRVIKGSIKEVTQFELIHEAIPQTKIRVVIEKIGSGKYVFRSVMPNSNKDKKRMEGTTKKRH